MVGEKELSIEEKFKVLMMKLEEIQEKISILENKRKKMKTDYKKKFRKLNPKRTDNVCCRGLCPTNFISEDDTLICGRCEEKKHIDWFLESSRFELCEACDNLLK